MAVTALTRRIRAGIMRHHLATIRRGRVIALHRITTPATGHVMTAAVVMIEVMIEIEIVAVIVIVIVIEVMIATVVKAMTVEMTVAMGGTGTDRDVDKRGELF